MLSARSRAVRGAAAAVMVGLLLAATAWGSDDWFPFAPFRMYAGYNPVDGAVASTTLQGVRPDGTVTRISDASLGLRRAELEGQLADYLADPDKLAQVDVAHRRTSPHEPAYAEIRIVQRRWQLDGGRVVAESETVLARWRRP